MKPLIKLDHRGLEAAKTFFYPGLDCPPLWMCGEEGALVVGYGETPQAAYCAWVAKQFNRAQDKPSRLRSVWDFFFEPVDLFARVA